MKKSLSIFLILFLLSSSLLASPLELSFSYTREGKVEKEPKIYPGQVLYLLAEFANVLHSEKRIHLEQDLKILSSKGKGVLFQKGVNLLKGKLLLPYKKVPLLNRIFLPPGVLPGKYQAVVTLRDEIGGKTFSSRAFFEVLSDKKGEGPLGEIKFQDGEQRLRQQFLRGEKIYLSVALRGQFKKGDMVHFKEDVKIAYGSEEALSKEGVIQIQKRFSKEHQKISFFHTLTFPRNFPSGKYTTRIILHDQKKGREWEEHLTFFILKKWKLNPQIDLLNLRRAGSVQDTRTFRAGETLYLTFLLTHLPTQKGDSIWLSEDLSLLNLQGQTLLSRREVVILRGKFKRDYRGLPFRNSLLLPESLSGKYLLRVVLTEREHGFKIQKDISIEVLSVSSIQGASLLKVGEILFRGKRAHKDHLPRCSLKEALEISFSIQSSLFQKGYSLWVEVDGGLWRGSQKVLYRPGLLQIKGRLKKSYGELPCQIKIDLPEGSSPGQYRLVLKVREVWKGAKIQREIPFEITGPDGTVEKPKKATISPRSN